MTKRHFFQIITVTVVGTLVINVLFGPYLSAKIATLPLVKRFNIINPNAPIVIDRKQEIRISDSSDILQAVSKAKSQISSIAVRSGNQLQLLGGLINLSSDGSFLTTRSVVPDTTKIGQYVVVTAGGQVALVDGIVYDPATNIAIVHAAVGNLPFASFAVSKDLNPGEKVSFVYQSLEPYSPHVLTSVVSFSQSEVANHAFSAGRPTRSFGVVPTSGMAPGSALINLDAKVIGMWDGASVITSDVLQQATRVYFAHQSLFVRPWWGFDYRAITPIEASVLSETSGAQVTKVVPGTPAASAGLLVNDVIVSVEGTKVAETSFQFEELFEKYSPGDAVKLSILRNNSPVTITIILGAMKN